MNLLKQQIFDKSLKISTRKMKCFSNPRKLVLVKIYKLEANKLNLIYEKVSNQTINQAVNQTVFCYN